MRRWILLLCLVLVWPVVALAAGPEKNPLSPWYLSDTERRWHVDGFLGIESEPDYVGSDDNESEPALQLRALFWDRFGNRYTLSFGEVGAVFPFGKRWAFTIDLELEEGRETENPDLQGLADGEETLEGEFALFRRIGNGYAFGVFQPDLLGRGKGIVYFLGYGHDFLSSGERWRLSPKVDISWADREHMQTEFGLTEAQAQILGLSAYAASGGLKSTTVGLAAERYFSRSFLRGQWSLLGSVEAEIYHGKAADSPLLAELGSEVTLEASVGFFFRF